MVNIENCSGIKLYRIQDILNVGNVGVFYLQTPSTGLKFTTVNNTSWCNANPIPSVRTHRTQRASLSPLFLLWELEGTQDKSQAALNGITCKEGWWILVRS